MESDAPRMRYASTVIGAPDARSLAHFYRRLLGWDISEEYDHWVRLADPDGGPGLSFQTEEGYAPPVWPAESGDQQMMMHLDIAADDLDSSVERAIDLGATTAPFQPQDDVRVMLDPDGHPFCLFERRRPGRRVVCDFEVTFTNGGGLQAQQFRFDIPTREIGDDELADLIVRDLRLLMVGT